jgi:rhodanese-related sulfurtransferase
LLTYGCFIDQKEKPKYFRNYLRRTSMSLQQIAHYQEKLAYEMDSWDLYLALKAGENIVVVDGRSSEAYAREHIPGAINLPHRFMSQDSLENLDKAPLYVTYCDGIGCNGSTKTALKMLNLGFRVKEMIGGLDWWKRDGYATLGEQGRAETMVDCGCGG